MKLLKKLTIVVLLFGGASGLSSLGYLNPGALFSSGSLCITCTDGPAANTGTCKGPRYARYCAGSGFTCDGTTTYPCGGDSEQ